MTSLLYVGFVLTGIVTTVLGPVLPWLTIAWGLSDAQAGALFGIQFGAGLAGGAASGAIATRAGVSRTLATGYALMGLGLIGIAFGGSHAGRVSLGFVGLGIGLVVPNTNVIVARLFPKRSAGALGGLNLCWGIGAASWPLIVAACPPHPGPRMALLIASSMLLVLSAVLTRTELSPPQPVDMPDDGHRGRAAGRLVIFGLAIAMYSGVEAAIGGWITEYVRRLGGTRFEAAASAFWGGLAAGRGMVAVFLAARLENIAVFCGLATVAVGLGVLLMDPGPLLISLSAVVCGLGLGPVFPVTVAAVSRRFPTRVAGPLVALGSFGAGTVPWVVGAIASRTGSLKTGLAALLAGVAILAAAHIARIRIVK
jgi:MFS transporter, FHS family, glucose/mannose:H+ symporter